MLGIVGTVPDPEFPLVHGPVGWDGDRLRVCGRRVEVLRGTPALLAAAAKATACLGGPEVYAFLVGDIGKGEGSRQLYKFLEQNLSAFDFQVLTFHYLQPDVDWHNRVLFAIDALPRRPLLIADAGFMYAAKMSGQAPAYDFFTPDAGELAFLADESAPHPFYTRGFILHQDNNVPELIRRAYQHGNAARHLVVKGSTDYIANEEGILFSVDQPSFDAMEAIGGTGDTLTGLLTVLCGAGYEPAWAALLAARANRLSGSFVTPTPATQVATLIEAIPQALADVLKRSPQT
jgi:hypothetical protein